jgi:hypothetical protein
MSSIIRYGDTYHGISVESRGVFTQDERGWTYAGQCKDGYACGLGVLKWSDGSKQFAEHGPDGQCDGRNLFRWADGDTWYRLFERGELKEYAAVFAGGLCKYNGVGCAPDDPRLLALIAQVAPVEVRSASTAPRPPLASPLARKQSSDGSAGSFGPRRRWRPPWPPRCSPARRRWWLRGTALQQPHRKAHPHSDAYTGHCGLTGGTLLHALTTAAWCTPMGPSRQRRCHAVVQHAAC